MKYWWGYLIALIFGGFSWGLNQLGEKYNVLVDMLYPYITRELQSFLARWTGSVDILVWQVLLLVLVIVALVILVLLLVSKGNIVRYVGWVLAFASVLMCLHTGIYSVNTYAGSVADDIRLDIEDYTQSDLEAATTFYRDQADGLQSQLTRDVSFQELADQAGSGFDTLVRQRSFSVFAGSREPVKELGWAGLASSLGITGYTCAFTGESAVNPKIPGAILPFTMCHEMAHRMCIVQDNDANFAAVLACEANESPEFRYSGYFMAFRYCYSALYAVDPDAATAIKAGCSTQLLQDLDAYDLFFSENEDEDNKELAEAVNAGYLKLSGSEDAEAPVSANVCDQLVNWYISEHATPEDIGQTQFDPYDETQVDLSGNVHYVAPAATETTQETEAAA